MRPVQVLVLATLFGSARLSLGQSDADPHWHEVCAAAKAQGREVPVPTGPIPESKLAFCDSSDLYYGITGKPDYAAAMQCAAYERAHPDAHSGDMFLGPGVLSMLYANGYGVARNYSAAIRFACEEQWASDAEMALRVGHLETLRDQNEGGAGFDLCDDITSGLSMGVCTSIQTRKADTKRNEEIAAVAERLPPAAQSGFARLQAAESAFEQARADNEVDLTGTARGMFGLQELKKLRDQFLTNLQRFGNGDVPKISAAELADLDRALNSVYRDIERAPADTWRYGTIKPDGIRETERRWVALEDAWVDFARQAYPNLDPNAVRAQIIRLRLHQLRSLAPRD